MGLQQAYLDRTGIVETWITSFSTAMCDVIDGSDFRATLARTLALADREGYHADADCLLVLAYAELCTGSLRGRRRADRDRHARPIQRHGALRAVAYRARPRPAPASRRRLDRRGHGARRTRSAADALAEYGVTRTP